MLTEISRRTWFWCGEQGRTCEHTQEWLNGVETGEKQCGHAGGPQWQKKGFFLQSGCCLNIISTFSFFYKRKRTFKSNHYIINKDHKKLVSQKVRAKNGDGTGWVPKSPKGWDYQTVWIPKGAECT
jgi:hypothetical protein